MTAESWLSVVNAAALVAAADFSAFAASRGDGLHPRLRELFDRTVTVSFSEVTIRPDGMLQAGPDPGSAKLQEIPRREDTFLDFAQQAQPHS